MLSSLKYQSFCCCCWKIPRFLLLSHPIKSIMFIMLLTKFSDISAQSSLVLLNWVNIISIYSAAAAAASLQSCRTLCNPIDGSPPISFSSAWEWKVKVNLFSLVRLLATPWTAAHQAPPSMGFSRQEYWSGLSLPSEASIQSVWKCAYSILHSLCIQWLIHVEKAFNCFHNRS